MNVGRIKAKYGQLDDSSTRSSLFSVSSALNDESSCATDTKSFATATTAIAIGPNGEVVVQSHKLATNRSSNVAKSNPSSLSRPETISEQDIKPRPKKTMVIGWQRNPTKFRETSTISTNTNAGGKQSQLERRKRTGWQKVTPKTTEARTAGVSVTQEKPIAGSASKEKANSQHSLKSANAKKKSEEQGGGATRRQENEDGKSSCMGSPGKINSTLRNYEIKGEDVSNTDALARVAAPTTGTPPSLASKKALHLRVYDGNRENRDSQRFRSRGDARRTKKKNASADDIFLFVREPVKKPTSTDVKVPDRVDKSTLGEVAKRLETQKQYEEDKRDAIGQLRGRRYRSGGPISNGGGSRSPGPVRRDRSTDQDLECSAEQTASLRDEPSQRSRSSSRPRRKPGRTLSGGNLRGINNPESKARGVYSPTYSGDKAKLIGRADTKERRRSSLSLLEKEKADKLSSTII